MQAQGVRFTLAPSAEYVRWDKDLGIKDDALLGGRIGADFGSLVSVSGYYHTRNGLGVMRDSAAATRAGVTGPLRTKTDITTFGANLALRLNPGRIAPFISVGAGVIRFDPDSTARRELINYRFGGGLQFDLSPNARAMVMLEDSRFRLPANALFLNATPAGSGATIASDTERSNLTLSGSVGFALGGSIDGDDPSADRWSAGSIPLEAFAGRLDFDDASMPRQALVGVRTGVDVGQYVGLRAFYWQGRSGDLEQKQHLQSYGGEAQLNLNASRGPAPFLIVGAGRLDYGEDYRDALGRPRESETAVILGGGVGIRLSDQVRLNASARDYVRGPQDLDSIASATQLSHNWLYSVGMAINFGRTRSEAPRIAVRDRTEELERELVMRRAMGLRVDTVYVERDPRSGERTLYRKDPRTGRMVRSTDMAPDSADMRARRMEPRMIMLPVPEFGELYVRYGDSTTRIMSPSMRMPGGGGMTTPRTEVDSLVRELRARIDSLEMRNRQRMTDAADAEAQALRTRIDSLEARLRARIENPPEMTVTMMPNRTPDRGGVLIAPTDTTAMMQDVPARRTFAGMQLRSVSPYIAGFNQFVVGVQADAGPIFGISSLRFVPDFAIGLGSDVSISLAGGAQYNFPLFRLNETSAVRPHLRASLGFVGASGDIDSHFGVGVAYGLTYAGRNNLANSRRPQLFIEHQGIDFFEANRFVLGLRMPLR